MEFTNPNFAPATPPINDHGSTDHRPEVALKDGDVIPGMPRLREVTNSPAQEYATRPGTVTPLPDNVAALICSFKGRAKVQRNGIKIERKELSTQPIFYWHEDSLTCLSKQGEHVLYVLNPNTLDCIHIMDAKGRYIETVVRKNCPDILDAEAQSKEIAKHRAYLTRQQNRLQELHGEDTEEILKRHRENTEEMTRATNLHPAPEENPPQQQDAAAPTADRIINRGTTVQNHIIDRANQRASASALGHAARHESAAGNRQLSTGNSRDEVSAEDWSTPNTRNQQLAEEPTEIENW